MTLVDEPDILLTPLQAALDRMRIFTAQTLNPREGFNVEGQVAALVAIAEALNELVFMLTKPRVE